MDTSCSPHCPLIRASAWNGSRGGSVGVRLQSRDPQKAQLPSTLQLFDGRGQSLGNFLDWGQAFMAL